MVIYSNNKLKKLIRININEIIKSITFILKFINLTSESKMIKIIKGAT